MHLSQEISDSWSPHSICWAERKEMKRNVEWKKGKNEDRKGGMEGGGDGVMWGLPHPQPASVQCLQVFSG